VCRPFRAFSFIHAFPGRCCPGLICNGLSGLKPYCFPRHCLSHPGPPPDGRGNKGLFAQPLYNSMFKFLSFGTIKLRHSGRSEAETRNPRSGWSHWIALKSFTSCPAFAGMMKKNLNIKYYKNITYYKSIAYKLLKSFFNAYNRRTVIISHAYSN
jgi:hypothetical protein